jgi:predicted O-methyltransferase YrrM
MDAQLREHAEAARGFMPPDEGQALFDAARSADARPTVDAEVAPLLEIGSYCGKSAVYLGAAARELGTVVFTVDHHRGSEENQAGWEHHEPDLVDSRTGKMDTLPVFRRTIHDAGLEDVVVAVVGESPAVGTAWTTGLSFLFIDGGHGPEPAHRDYELWVPHVLPGGLLAIHDVFPRPEDGGRPPYEIFCRAVESGAFAQVSEAGSLRVLRRVADGH